MKDENIHAGQIVLSGNMEQISNSELLISGHRKKRHILFK